MQTKILLLALSAAAFSSCSTAYKSAQTPDDVYYSPVRVVEEEKKNEREVVQRQPEADYQISMGIRDRRWRDFRNDYDFYDSPYNYACNSYSYGYYYNPFYYPRAIYTGKPTYSKPLNTTPRMVNLNTYNGYNKNVAAGKTFNTPSGRPANQYNNSNNSNSRVGNLIREVITPSSSSSNNTRTYTPSSSSSSSSGSSSSGSSPGSVSRPARGN
ncbi:MAG TPA: hypothetical protein VK489_07950 [Ferruginibacter sp.]|nr:hypothetical protein [Ferruginibacter sp.]